MTRPPPGTFTLRPAEARDLDAVLLVEAASFSTPWSRRTFAALLNRDTVAFRVLDIVPADGGAPVVAGHGIVWWVGPEAEIANVAMAPAFRGQGWGGVLVDGLVAEAGIRGVERIFLEVRESNSSARALYERRGFVSVGRRRGYYAKPREDALIMACELTDAANALPAADLDPPDASTASGAPSTLPPRSP